MRYLPFLIASLVMAYLVYIPQPPETIDEYNERHWVDEEGRHREYYERGMGVGRELGYIFCLIVFSVYLVLILNGEM